jgi:hypothetical protein
MDILITILMVFGLTSAVVLVVGVWTQCDMTRKRNAEAAAKPPASSPEKSRSVFPKSEFPT